MASGLSQQASWLLENGPRELELLFRAIVYHPSVPILILDDERNYCDASTGAGKLLGLSRDKIIGQKMDDFADPSFRPGISELWRAFLAKGEQEGTLRLAGPNGTSRMLSIRPKATCCRYATFSRCATRQRLRKRSLSRKLQESNPIMGTGLCTVPPGRRGTYSPLVFGSRAHLRLQRR